MTNITHHIYLSSGRIDDEFVYYSTESLLGCEAQMFPLTYGNGTSVDYSRFDYFCIGGRDCLGSKIHVYRCEIKGGNMFGLLTSFYLITGVSLAVIVVLITALLYKNKKYGNSKALMMLSFFVVCSLLLIAMYYFTTYMGETTEVWGRGPMGRCVEYVLSVLIIYSYLLFVRVNLVETGCNTIRLNRTADVVLLIVLILSLICCIFCMDDNYFVAQPAERSFAIVINLVLMSSICLFNLAYLWLTIKSGMQKQTKTYIVLILILLMMNAIYQDILTIRLITGNMPFAAESFYVDSAFVTVIITVLITLIYVFRNDFQPTYLHEDTLATYTDDREILRTMIEEKGLTEREGEIINLMYDGHSYESAAQQLYISKYTVKNHVHNAYMKLGLNSRSDLIAAIHEFRSAQNTK